MGSGGSGKGYRGGNTGGLSAGDVVSTDSLISAREGKRSEVDQTLTVLRDVHDQYGVQIEDVQIATLKGAAARSVMAYYDAGGNLAVNENYFNGTAITAAYDKSVASGFHPGRGSKTGMEAVVAHEMGHRLADVAAQKGGGSIFRSSDRTSSSIITTAAKQMKTTSSKLMASISGYAKQSYDEAIAEAFADVYCNGRKASRASRTVVSVLNGRLK